VLISLVDGTLVALAQVALFGILLGLESFWVWNPFGIGILLRSNPFGIGILLRSNHFAWNPFPSNPFG